MSVESELVSENRRVANNMIPRSGSPAWWNLRYHKRETPWDGGIVPPELHEIVDSGYLPSSGIALDMGCGTGTNANFLARRGFLTVGVDVAWLALQEARQKSLSEGLPTLYCLGDVADLSFLNLQANFVLDIGCFHSLPSAVRDGYMASLAGHMVSGGYYLVYGFDRAVNVEGESLGLLDGEVAARFGSAFRLQWRRPSTEGDRTVAWYLLERE
ncbi:MAG: class I SAM-dependent methyltransferase [Chloroflexota bacterium]|nr:class I SAM-dependent methyltransferase [Chloroflexota bacterium]